MSGEARGLSPPAASFCSTRVDWFERAERE